MREDRPSSTSTAAALWRAVATTGVTHVRDFADPFAALLLPPWPARFVTGLGIVLERRPELLRRLVDGRRIFSDFMALRTRGIDAAWDDARCGGASQLVILGAGLDARAFRLPGLSDVRVFEVDHPATQAFKRERARGLRSPARALTFVPVDFARDDLGTALRAAGLSDAERSFWIWEGVTNYLPHEATAATLATIASLSPAGSLLAMTYGEPIHQMGAVQRARRLLLQRLREPHIGLLEREHAARLLDESGWRLRQDLGLGDMAERFSDGPTPGVMAHERLAVAEKV
jgi:methyltransferase (TIGR00027 family)